MKIKNVALMGVKAGLEDGLKEGEFIVYPSTFTREPDAYGDVIAKGAFLDAMTDWKDSGDVMPGMFLHDPNQIVAAVIDMGEDDRGWWVKGEFDEDPEAQRIYRHLKGRRLSSLSFAYDTLDEGQVELTDGRKANELRKLMPLEFSFLPKGFGANPDTSVVAVKSAVDALAITVTGSVKEGCAVAVKNIDSLRQAQEALGVAIAALEGSNPDEASGEVDAKDKEPIVAKSKEQTPAPSAKTWEAELALLTLNREEGIQS